MITLVDAAAMTMWLDAACHGNAAPDDVVAALGPVHVAGWTLESPATALSLVVAELGRQTPAVRTLLALCVPGDPGPLIADAQVLRAAASAGAAIVLDPLGIALIADPDSPATTWIAHRLDSAFMEAPDLVEAHRSLRRALRMASDDLELLDVAAGRDRVDPTLLRRRRRQLPDHVEPARVALLDTALGLAMVLDAADIDPGAALSASALTARRQVLQELRQSVRRAVEAAAGSPIIDR